ncbi:MAG: hypothetical protein ACRD96_08420, partial [Bryobacteraceae bacterium]
MSRIVCLWFAFASLVFAQSGPLFCTPSAVPPLVHSEGLAERLGDILLDCAGGPPGPVAGNLAFFLTVPIANQVSATGVVDAILTVDNVAVTAPATLLSSNAIVFNGFTFTVPPSGRVSIRLTNLRGNVNVLGFEGGQIVFASLAFN